MTEHTNIGEDTAAGECQPIRRNVQVNEDDSNVAEDEESSGKQHGVKGKIADQLEAACEGFDERVLLEHLCILLIGVWLVWNWFARRLRILMYLYQIVRRAGSAIQDSAWSSIRIARKLM